MPPFSNLDDPQLASILTYIRREWGNGVDVVDPATVARVRHDTQGREGPWTREELQQLESRFSVKGTAP